MARNHQTCSRLASLRARDRIVNVVQLSRVLATYMDMLLPFVEESEDVEDVEDVKKDNKETEQRE